MRALGFQSEISDPKKVKELMDQADKDGSGTIDQDEFTKLMARFISGRDIRSEIEKAFKMYDDDDGGTIGIENLQSVRQDIAKDKGDEDIAKITDDELKLMLKIGDPGPHERYMGKEVDF